MWTLGILALPLTPFESSPPPTPTYLLLQQHMTTPNSNYRYILIDTPEKKAKYAPKQETDELFTKWGAHKWIKNPFKDKVFSPDNYVIYRRPLTPPTDYEIVPEAEARLFDGLSPHSDIMFYNVNEWQGAKFPRWDGTTTFCRRITTQSTAIEEHDELKSKSPHLAENPWHSLKGLRVEDLPKDVKLEFYASNSIDTVTVCGPFSKEDYGVINKNYTHYRLHIPPPEKVVDEAQECHDAWMKIKEFGYKKCIDFALNWAKERGEK